jgi:hypothetical protein
MFRVSLVVLLCLGAPVAAEAGPNQEINDFQRANPGYRERAGTFYENEYLPGAAAGLARAAGNPRLSEAARRLLRAFVYDWLDAYISGDGALNGAAHAAVLRRLDDRVREALCDDAAYARYLAWRRQAQGADNPLDFLMRPPG